MKNKQYEYSDQFEIIYMQLFIKNLVIRVIDGVELRTKQFSYSCTDYGILFDVCIMSILRKKKKSLSHNANLTHPWANFYKK